MRQLFLSMAIFCLICPDLSAAAAEVGPISLYYPRDESAIAAPSTFLVGSCPPGTALTCDGLPVRLNNRGFFAHVVKLKAGVNRLRLMLDSQPPSTRDISIKRESTPAPLPAAPLKLSKDSLDPREDLGLTPGDLIGLAVRASPGSRVEAVLGTRRVVLPPAARSRGQAANRGLDAAYGLSFQRFPANQQDLYCGFYRVDAADRWQGISPRFIARKAGRQVALTGAAKLTVLSQPWLAETVHDDTVVRLGPGQARTTPLPKGVRLLVDGWQGTAIRCNLSSGRHVYIAKEDLLLDRDGGDLPSSAVRTVNVQPDRRGIRIVVPLTQRLPFQIEQQLKPNKLVLRVFGATADTDWITETPPTVDSRLIDNVTWKQGGDRLYELTAHLEGSRQWGFWADYEGTNLVLHVKAPPRAVAGNRPLAGVTVCVDPGHGGDETGSIGPSGVRESAVNLAIAMKLKESLEREGAAVVMTRTSEKENPTLADRVRKAGDADADLLVSVHNNALPDGRDPWQEHGTSSYWYHPQSIELARTIKGELVHALGFPDFGTFYQNLALTRPTRMPATLIEVGFMINPDEYGQLIDPTVQQKAADAMALGVRKYLSGGAR